MKKINILITLIFISFFGIINVNASTKTYERTETDLGVNKKWTINSSNINNVYATPRVDATEKIYDFADIFSNYEETQIYDQAKKFIDKTDMDLVILTTDLQYSDTQIEEYAADFYDYNDFGLDLEYYSGIILIINMNTYNRFYNIFTFGNGMIYYNDIRLEDTLDYMYNDMASGNYKTAVTAYIDSLDSYYMQGIPEANKDAHINEMGDIVYPYHPPIKIALIASTIMSFIITLFLVSRNKMVKKATRAKEYLDKSSINYKKQEDLFLHTHTSSYVVTSSSGGGGGSSFGGSSSHSGSSGGFHGGGSGRHF